MFGIKHQGPLTKIECFKNPKISSDLVNNTEILKKKHCFHPFEKSQFSFNM